MQKSVEVNIPHDLGRVEARRRLEQGFGRLRSQIAGNVATFEESWSGDRLTFRAGALGQTVSGRLDVFDQSVRIEVDLPWFLAAVAEKLKGRLQQEGTLLLEKK